MVQNQNSQRKTRVGVVLSNKMEKTVTVAVDRLVLHPVFKKYHKRRTKLKAHDQENQCQIGDLVEMTESRPLSKTKRWVVTSILKKAALDAPVKEGV